jgi:hypothetical protein
MRPLSALLGSLRSRRSTSSLHARPFYRAHPFDSPISIKDVDQRGLIDDDLRIFYNRIPKVANTTLVFSLAKMRTGKAPESPDVKKDFRRPSHLNEAEVNRLKDYLKVVFVRDPFTRTLSAYLNKIVARFRADGRLPAPEGLRFESIPSFPEFCAYLADGGLHDNVHWAPQTSLMLLPLSQFDIVGRFERFETDARNVLARLGAPDCADSIVTFSTHSTRANDRIDDFYDAESRAIVRHVFRADREALGY